MSYDGGASFVPFGPSAPQWHHGLFHIANSEIPCEEVFNITIQLLKLNYQRLNPSSPLTVLHVEPLKHHPHVSVPFPSGAPPPFPSPSPLAIASQQTAAIPAAARGDASASLSWHCSSSWPPWAWRWRWDFCYMCQVGVLRVVIFLVREEENGIA